jgi:hypothetical protein
MQRHGMYCLVVVPVQAADAMTLTVVRPASENFKQKVSLRRWSWLSLYGMRHLSSSQECDKRADLCSDYMASLRL